MLARLAEGGGEPLVLGDRLGELALGLEHPLLEGPYPLRGVLEATAQNDDLFLEGLQLRLQVADLPLVLRQPPVVLGRHSVTSNNPAGASFGPYTGSSRAPYHLSHAFSVTMTFPPSRLEKSPQGNYSGAIPTKPSPDNPSLERSS